ncbi:MAG: hypothetical protein ACR2PL_02635 [Dehalococcoidia bacterium]
MRLIPQITDGLLSLPDRPAEPPLAVGSSGWLAWLADPATRSFAFRGARGSFTARKERRQRGGGYWSAYRKQGGRLRKAYLGKADEITPARLEAVAAVLDLPTGDEVPGGAGRLPRSEEPAPAPGERRAADSLLRTKLFAPPPRPDLVPRPRLLARLTVGLSGKLTLIAAPAGFGKTTLVSAWGAACPRPTAWLSLDEADNDPARFLAYLVAALQTIAEYT